MTPHDDAGTTGTAFLRRMRFADEALERTYRTRSATQMHLPLVGAILLAILVYVLVVGLDVVLLASTDKIAESLQIRSVWFILALLAHRLAHHHPETFDRFQQAIVFSLALGLNLTIIVLTVRFPEMKSYIVGAVMAEFYAVLLGRLSPAWTLTLCLSTLFGFLAGWAPFSGLGAQDQIGELAFLAVMCLLAPVAAAIQDGHLRRSFLQQVQLEALLARHRESAELHREMAIRDPLTGAYNRRRFDEMALRETERFHRYGAPFAVLLVDLDHFKRINDSYGHLVGDEVLRRFAHICDGALRGHDLFARIGGEEFAILLGDASLRQAEATAERLRRLVEATEVPTPDGPLRFTVSIGVAVCGHADGSPDAVVKRADAALYAAKLAGRNRVIAQFEDGTVPALAGFGA